MCLVDERVIETCVFYGEVNVIVTYVDDSGVADTCMNVERVGVCGSADKGGVVAFERDKFEHFVGSEGVCVEKECHCVCSFGVVLLLVHSMP